MTVRLKHLGRAIRTARTRIRDHSPLLRDSEFRTRLALIDPILDALGWQVGDPGNVIVEYRDRNSGYAGRVDYALLKEDGSPCVMIEAKRLGELGAADPATSRLAGSQVQMLAYADAAGIGPAALTDGDRWILYDLHRKGSLPDRVRFDIRVSQSDDEAAEHLLELSRRRLVRSVVVSKPLPTPATRTAIEWIPLADFVPGKGPLPARIRFEDGSEHATDDVWSSLIAHSARWLYARKLLTTSKMPVRLPGSDRLAVDSRPLPWGRPFPIVGTPFHTTVADRDFIVSVACRLFKICGRDPSAVSVSRVLQD